MFCIATTRFQAERIVERLEFENFSNNDISALFADPSNGHDFANGRPANAPAGAGASAETGGVVGGALGWLAGIGALAVSGVGAFIAAGPISGALSGAAVGGIVGGLIRLGLPELEARRFEVEIQKGNLLVSVHNCSAEQLDRAHDIFNNAGAQEICSTGASSTPKENQVTYRTMHPALAAYSQTRA